MRYEFELRDWKAALAVFWIIWSSVISVLWLVGVLS